MFRKLIVSVALLVLLTPGVALAAQYPPTTSPPPTTSTTQPGGTTSTTQPGGTTPTTQPGGTTTTSTVLVGPNEPNGGQPQTRPPGGGALPRTGADTIALLVRIGVVLLVAGFVLYLAGRNRRAARADDDSGLGTA